MSNCLSVTIGIQSRGACVASVPDKGSNINASVLPKYSASSVCAEKTADVICGHPNRMEVTIGFVCGTDIGAAILHASDGALITLDGQYLIVED